MSENKALQAEMQDNHLKSSKIIDNLKKDKSALKTEKNQIKLEANHEKIVMFQNETIAYLDFVNFMMEHLLLETEELPKLSGSLQNRIDGASSAMSQPGNHGFFQSLQNITNAPNYDNLRREILNQPTFNQVSDLTFTCAWCLVVSWTS